MFILPFVDEAATLRSYYTNLPVRLFYIRGEEPFLEGDCADVTVYYDSLLDFYFMDWDRLDTVQCARLNRLHSHNATCKVNVVHIDYCDLCGVINMDESAAGLFLRGRYHSEPIDLRQGSIISMIAGGEHKGVRESLSKLNEEARRQRNPLPFEILFSTDMEVNEAAIPLEVLAAADDVKAVRRAAQPVTLSIIEDIIARGGVSEKVPVLAGQTAVAKSAMVEALAKKYNFRVVDYRCAFISRIDVLGMYEYDKEKGISSLTGAEKIVTCSDQYIQMCADKAVAVREKIALLKEEPTKRGVKQQLAILEDALKHFEGESRIPVLFLDEFNRADPTVQQSFMTFFTSRKLLQYTFNAARVILAVNVSSDGSFENTTHQFSDVAFTSRMIKLEITPEVMFDKWVEYITDSGWHFAVREFIAEGGIAVAYAEKEKPDSEEASTGLVSYPTFRTWERVSSHLLAVEDYLGVSRQGVLPSSQAGLAIGLDWSLIKGVLGVPKEHPVVPSGSPPYVPVYERFRDFMQGKADEGDARYVRLLESASGHYMSGGDPIMRALVTAAKSDMPYMIVGPSSFGKSTRVASLEKTGKFIVLQIPLGNATKTDVAGPPNVVTYEELTAITMSLEKRDNKGVRVGLAAKDIKATRGALSGIFSEGDAAKYGMNKSVMRYFPNTYLLNALTRARAEKKILVLFFDELNRADPSVASAVFEAVSNRRFMGVTWDKGEVFVVSAVNPPLSVDGGASPYGEVYGMDPAFGGRFCILKVDKIEKEHVQSVVDWWFTEKYHPALLEYAKRMLGVNKFGDEVKSSAEMSDPEKGWEAFAAMMQQVDLNTFEDQRVTLRSFTTLSTTLKETRLPEFSGACLSSTGDLKISDYLVLDFDADPISSFEAKLRSIIKELPRSLAVETAGGSVKIGDTEFPIGDIVDTLKGVGKQFTTPAYKAMSETAKRKMFRNIRDIVSALQVSNMALSDRRTMGIHALLGSGYNEDEMLASMDTVFSGAGAGLTIPELTEPDLVTQYLEQLIRTCKDSDDFPGIFTQFIEAFYDHFKSQDTVSRSTAIYEWLLSTKDEFGSIVEPARLGGRVFLYGHKDYAHLGGLNTALRTYLLDMGSKEHDVKLLGRCGVVSNVEPDSIELWWKAKRHQVI